MKSSKLHLLTCSLLTLLPISCSEDNGADHAVQYPPNTSQKADTKFLRFTDESRGEGVMEAAIATYEGKNGEKVELISAVHVADTVYYERLEKLFAGYDSVLYELIKAKGVKPPEKGRRERGESGGMVSWFQRYMRDTLQLDFQLEAIDYRAKNFVHADLDAETFQRLSEERGETIVQLMLKLALAEFKIGKEGKSKTDQNIGLKLIAALFMPDSARALKYLFAQQLENMESLMAGLGEGPDGKGSVLLTERNKKCMSVLRERLKRGDKNIGVFYGGAHMADLEKRIFKEIGFRRTGVRWEQAWVVRRAEQPPAKKPAKK